MTRMRFSGVLLALLLACANALGQSAATSEVYGRVTDDGGRPLTATLTLQAEGEATSQSVTAGADGTYRFPNLPPGHYIVQATHDGTDEVHAISLVPGQQAENSFTLSSTGAEPMRLSVDSAAEQVSRHETSGAFAVTKRLIDSLPIDGRNYVQFTLTNSEVKRDTAPSISVLPTSGLSINGQRARMNLVNVDGGNAEDSVSNGIGSTVSQETVQEFYVLTNAFAPEYGHALGGVVNVVTRGGDNQLHGSAYAYVRDRRFAAANPLSTVRNPAYTRVQPGFVLGGPLKKDRTHFFLSYETTRRHETGFSTIGHDNFGLVNIDVSRFFFPGATILGTPEQSAFLSSPATPVNQQTTAYAALVGGGSSIALAGAQPLFLGGSATFPTSGAPLPPSFVPLNSIIGNSPLAEGTSIWSLRLDHRLTDAQQLMLRVSVSPSTVQGIQGSGPSGNSYGLTSFGRTVRQQYRDYNLLVTDVTTLGADKVNEVRFRAARRGNGFDFNRGSAVDAGTVSVDLPGYAFFGQDPQSPLAYVEKRFQFLDQFSWIGNTHSLRLGGEFTTIPVNAQINAEMGGDYGFAPTILFPGLPAFSTVQSYGLGLPQSLTQTIGAGQLDFSTQRAGFFAQDSWTLHPRLTLNYGLRYDVEFNPTSSSSADMAAVARRVFGVQQSLPFDGRNLAPRVGLAWDVFGDGNTVMRAAYGVFYDHPPTGVVAYASLYDGSKTPLLLLLGGNPCPIAGGSASPFNLSATNAFQGTLTNPNCYGPLPGYDADQQRFNPADPSASAIFANQGYLSLGIPLLTQPASSPVVHNFRDPRSQQASWHLEHALGRNYTMSLGYVFNSGHRLYQPINANPMNRTALVENWERAVAAGAAPPDSSPYAVASCGVGPAGMFAPAALLSFFRPSGINPSLTTAFAPCMPLALPVASQYGVGTGNPLIPFGDVMALSSHATSNYHGLTAGLRRRMGNHAQFQASYTWSHAIDDAYDFYIDPQNDLAPSQDRSNSSLDQRHRFVFSGLYQTGVVSDGKGWNRLLSHWTFAPLIAAGSGTPFNIVLGTSPTDRPMIAASSTQSDLCGNTAVGSRYSPTGYLIPPCLNDGVYDGKATLPVFGNLGRNAGIMPWTLLADARLSRRFQFGDRLRLDASADVFNLPNRINVSGVHTIYTKAGIPTATYDARLLQFGLKLTW
ncbi:MAG TPA: TonB-dependent receptor [Terriglobales bacterium]|nr:TonB-dependent receptor [Terriglobales bacterium]